jgi:hypothetical protein
MPRLREGKSEVLPLCHSPYIGLSRAPETLLTAECGLLSVELDAASPFSIPQSAVSMVKAL